MQMEPVVRMQRVTKIKSSRTLVDNLTLDVPAGQIFGFLGPNGAGKTTTIRMMVGLISLTEGDIHICGHSIKTDFERAIAHVGAIVENPEMYKFMTGYQNLLHYARMNPGVDRGRIEEAVRLVGLEGRIREKVKTYSLGMRQRLGVAQAILHRPQLLILDEPTNGLDPQGIRELRDYLRHLSRTEGTTIFVSSHLLSEMELMCDSVAIIQNGRLVGIRDLNNTAGTPGSARVAFEVNDPQQAQIIAGGGLIEGGSLILDLGREETAQLNSRLAAAGIHVYSIHRSARTLEDQFLEMTGGETSIG
ncbi:ABC transporter ATP-binding protein [Paenibacillus medicaginis]|uniref:ABC transporter ATP-binding protein n=1 Tax=Paenibacillus medicaginis TaxID=1470560 RepID=A0ABV5C817_9BACL